MCGVTGREASGAARDDVDQVRGEGGVEGDEREGRLRWQPIAGLATLPIPASDAFFGPAALDPSVPFFEATMRFDGEERLIGYDIHRT